MSDDTSEKPDFWMRPILSVSDVRASVDYYCAKLGFQLNWSRGDAGLFIAEVERPGIELILDGGSGLPTSQIPVVLALELHEHVNLNELYEELKQRGAIVRTAPFQVTWQPKMHQMEVADLDGNLLLFFGDL